MKINKEKRPKSLVVLDIELDQDQVEKELNRAARRLAQKHTIPGFRKGKAPRFIIENYFGRAALMEEASQDLINNSYKQALENEQINPVAQGQIEDIVESETFRFKVAVPVPPSVTIPDYRTIRMPLEVEEVDDAQVERAMDARRERHVVLRELDEPRPAQQGDQLTVKLETFIDGESLENYPEDQEAPDSNLVLEPERLVPELYEGLLGMTTEETREIVAHMPDDHENEQVRDKDVTFKVHLVGIQERILPDWEELPLLEEVEGDLDDLRADTRQIIETNARNEAEKDLIESFIDQLVEETDYDLPEVMIEESANNLLEEQASQYTRYGITLDQILEYRGQSREDAVAEMLPMAEDRLKRHLALFEVVQREQIEIQPEEVEQESEKVLEGYNDETREQIKQTMAEQLYNSIVNTVLDRKLRKRLVEIATGTAPELPAPEEPTTPDDATEESALPEATVESAAEPAASDTAATPDKETT